MADLIVAAGTVLKIDATFAMQPQYDVFRMEANSSIRAEVDLTITARRAEFGSNCIIDASGEPGTTGVDGVPAATLGLPSAGGTGGDGGPGGSGQNGRRVTIDAGLGVVGTLAILSIGGAAGRGGHGGNGGTGVSGGAGGTGGIGGHGGDGGPIAVRWMPLTAGLGGHLEGAPNGHVYSAAGGATGPGGLGGYGGRSIGPDGPNGISAPNGIAGADGAAGNGTAPVVTWRPRSPAQLLWVQKQDIGPASRVGHAMAFDPARRVAVLFGGSQGAKFLADTWEWDGVLWVQVGDTGPTQRLTGLAYDPVNARVLLFGGRGQAPNENTFGDTWLWDGQVWLQVEDAGPSPRTNFALATDPVRRRVVLFGGQAFGGAAGEITLLGDTWEWDGTEWTQLDDVGPSRRTGATMAYDPVNARLLLFGGFDGILRDDTWGWDGTRWQQIADIGPRPRMGHAMAPSASGVILFGGTTSLDPPQLVGDTWAFYEERWRQVQDMGPSPRSGHTMTFDDLEQRLIMFGGERGGALAQDTWHLAERPQR